MLRELRGKKGPKPQGGSRFGQPEEQEGHSQQVQELTQRTSTVDRLADTWRGVWGMGGTMALLLDLHAEECDPPGSGGQV